MSINWGFIQEVAKSKAETYAKAYPTRTLIDAYFAGYMLNAAERESLRVIVEELQKPEKPEIQKSS